MKSKESFPLMDDSALGRDRARESFRAIRAATRSEAHVRPLYGSYCFSEIPQTIFALFHDRKPILPIATGEKVERVFLFFLDSFGWTTLEENRDEIPFINEFFANGIASQMTSQFPSTTAAHVTTLGTGMTVGEHGVYEWNLWEPSLDAMITPLTYSFAGSKDRNTLPPSEANPEILYPEGLFYASLTPCQTDLFLPSGYIPSPFNSRVSGRGCEMIAYRSLEAGFDHACERITSREQPSFTSFYYGEIDALGHQYGPRSRERRNELKKCFIALEQLWRRLSRFPRTLFALCADHGMAETDPAETLYLNKLLPGLDASFERQRNGTQPRVPAGSARDFFLHVLEPEVQAVRMKLQTELGLDHEVLLVEDLIRDGYFGPVMSERFRERVGNIVILPPPGKTVWWYEPGRFEYRFRGMHGGLSKEEMILPWLTLAS